VLGDCVTKGSATSREEFAYQSYVHKVKLLETIQSCHQSRVSSNKEFSN